MQIPGSLISSAVEICDDFDLIGLLVRMLQEHLERLHRILNQDFCPGANRWVYWMKHPLASVGAVGFVAIVCGIYVNPYSFVLFGVLSAIALLGIFWPKIAIRGLTAEAEFLSTRCRVGGSVLVRLRIRNRWPWPAWGLSIRHGFGDISDLSTGMSLARVGGWSETEFEWLFQPDRRGVFPLDEPKVDTGFPFGLLHARTSIDLRNQLIVWPRSVALDAMPDAVEIHSREDRLSDRRIGDCGDILGTRSYREGDSLRRVHWAQTARFGRLIVTERQSPATCAVLLRVDVDSCSHRVRPENSTLETTLSVTASIVESLHRQHAYLEVSIGGSHYCVGASINDLRQVLDALARIPFEGEVPASETCPFDRTSKVFTTIDVTTDIGFDKHRTHHHHGNGRFVIIHSSADSMGPSHRSVAGCNCRGWVDLDSGDRWEGQFPRRWRDACHVA